MIASKQIAKLMTAFVGVSGFASAGGTSDTVTGALTTALSTASYSGGSVPLQVGSSNQEGVDTAAGFNETPIYSTASGKRLTDANGNDVFGIISFASGTWSLSYFSAPGGTQTAYTMAASTSISFEVPYVFSFADLPMRAGTGVAERHVAPDVAAYGFRLQPDSLTVTATNTLSSLSQTYAGGVFMLIVNGVLYGAQDAAAAFSVSGKAVTWNPANAGFPLATTDDVLAFYSY